MTAISQRGLVVRRIGVAVLVTCALTISECVFASVVPYSCASADPVPFFSPDLRDDPENSYVDVVNPDRVSVAPAPQRPGGRAVRVEAWRHDAAMTKDSRVQLSSAPRQGIGHCAVFWFGVTMLLRKMDSRDISNFMSVASPHVNYIQFYGPPYGSSAPLIFEQYAKAGRRYLGLRASWVAADIQHSERLWSRPIIEDDWFRIMFKVRASASGNQGFVEMWFQGSGDDSARRQKLTGSSRSGLVDRYYYPTVREESPSIPGAGMRMDIQVYRPVRIPVDVVRAYFCDEVIANSLKAVRARASSENPLACPAAPRAGVLQ